MSAQHTPGPWWLSLQAEKHSAVYCVCAGGLRIAIIPYAPLEDEPNARLMVAAPDMLEALYAARVVLDANTQAYAQVNAAIKKATGNA